MRSCESRKSPFLSLSLAQGASIEREYGEMAQEVDKKAEKDRDDGILDLEQELKYAHREAFGT